MSYWDLVNGGSDVAGSQSPEGEILEALIAAKIPAPEAERIARAFGEVYAKQADLQGLLNAALQSQRGGTKTDPEKPGDREVVDDKPGEEPGLNVAGSAVIDGDLAVSGTISTNNLRVFNTAQVLRRLEAAQGVFRTVEVPGVARLGNGAANIDAPLIANRPALMRQGGRYAGDNTFDGNVNLAGQVVWRNKLCQPANVVLTQSLNPAGGGVLKVSTREAFVLRDHGNGQPQTLEWSYEPSSTKALVSASLETKSGNINNYSLSSSNVSCVTEVQTASVPVVTSLASASTSWSAYSLSPVSISCVADVKTTTTDVATGVNTSPVSWTNYTLSDVNLNCVASVQTAPITVVTKVGFDPNSCAVTSDTTTIYSVVGVSTASLAAATYTGSATQTAVGSVSVSTSKINTVASVTSGSYQAATYSSSATLSALASVTPTTGSVNSVSSVGTGSVQSVSYAPPTAVAVLTAATLNTASGDVAGLAGNVKITATA